MDGLSIVQLIEEELKKQGISKGKFYKESGISSATFSQWRTGIYSPSSEALRKVEKYLGITFTIGQKEKPANNNVDELHLTENEVKLILWLRSLPPEMREAVLNIPTGSGTSDNHQA